MPASLPSVASPRVLRYWILPLAALSGAASAQPRAFDVPPGTLAHAIVLLGRQGSVTIVGSDPALGSVMVRGVQGRMEIVAALRILLRGSRFEAVRVDPATFVVRRLSTPVTRAMAVPFANPAIPTATPDIVVTAAKQKQPLRTFAGTVHVVDLDRTELRNNAADGSEALIAMLPVMASTGLGPGRDKIFIRGIADSSFSGPTQSTVGQYLGDVRLNYNAPDPDLQLYDVASIEVLEGPQATLYGAGSLGGIVRTIPRRPRTGSWEASLTSSGSLAANGHAGYELAGVVNAPISGNVAARFVAYANSVPGIINDSRRGLQAVDRLRTTGGRGILSAQFGGGWSVETMGVHQHIDHADARYSEGSARATRASAIAQPAADNFALGAVTLRKIYGSLEIVGVVSGVANDLAETYDLAALSPGLSASQRRRARIASGEARVSRSHDDGTGWLIGLHGLRSTDVSVATIANDDRIQRTTSIRTRILDGAAFGEGTFGIAPRWRLTLGARLSYAEADGDGRIVGAAIPASTAPLVTVPRTNTVRLLPAAAIGWQPTPAVTAYMRYQRGYRVGGPTVRAGESQVAGIPPFSIALFRPDAIDMVEAGLRFGQSRSSVLRGAMAVSASQWRNIQADLFDTIGAYTANIGDGRIVSLEANGRWQATKTLEVAFALFAAHARLLRSDERGTADAGQQLPNVPKVTARLDVTRRFAAAAGWQLSTRLGVRYVGASRLGTGRDYLTRQGDYLDTGVTAELGRINRTIFTELSNLLNVTGNRFASGNPYTAAGGDQRTPLRPRTIRVGTRITF